MLYGVLLQAKFSCGAKTSDFCRNLKFGSSCTQPNLAYNSAHMAYTSMPNLVSNCLFQLGWYTLSSLHKNPL